MLLAKKSSNDSMPVTNDNSVNGRMHSEVTDCVILDLVPDALGSIHSVVDQTATAVKTMRYKPYGEVLSRSGSISDRMCQWAGTYGSRATFNYVNSHDLTARHHSQTPGNWTTVAPLRRSTKKHGHLESRSCQLTNALAVQTHILQPRAETGARQGGSQQ